MKGRLLVLAQDRPRPLAALVEDGTLVDLLTDEPATGVRAGEIRLGVVRQVLTRTGAALLDIGGEQGFLPKGAALSPGARVLVEVLRAADGDKDARVSESVSYGGRLLVHTPRAPGINASRRITDAAERARLTNVLEPLAAKGGWVIRTMAAGVTDVVLLDAARAALDARRRVEAMAADAAPGCLRPAPDAIARALSDWPDAPTIIADAAAAARAPGAITEGDPLEVADLHGALRGLTRARHDLGGGAWLSIEPTEALVAVDVNAGGMAASEANRLAARALPRQLRLRGLGGVVAVDFAGSPGGEARKALVEAVSGDAGIRVAGWGPLGFLIMERARDRPRVTEEVL